MPHAVNSQVIMGATSRKINWRWIQHGCENSLRFLTVFSLGHICICDLAYRLRFRQSWVFSNQESFHFLFELYHVHFRCDFMSKNP